MTESDYYSGHRIQSHQVLPTLWDIVRRINYRRNEKPHLYHERNNILYVSEADIECREQQASSGGRQHCTDDEQWEQENARRERPAVIDHHDRKQSEGQEKINQQSTHCSQRYENTR